jgi:dTDP-4-amino-4,6-dideoxygalactose transaminase
MKIPFVSFEYMHKPIKSEMLKAFEDFYDSNWFVLGNRVKQFEQEYALFNKVQETIGVSNGLDALHIALKVLGIGKGDDRMLELHQYP